VGGASPPFSAQEEVVSGLRVSVALGIVATAIIAAQCAEIRDVRGNHRATLKLLEAESKAAAYTLDTIKARNAEREIGDQKHADSLRRLVATFKGRAPIIVRDTVQMPVAEYVFITDTLVPKCALCAARLDSAVLAARAEREAATLLHSSLESRLQWWVRHDKPHHSLRTKLQERISVGCGYGITKVGSEVLAGPQCGLALRIWP
jgi:hypothetical protein